MCVSNYFVSPVSLEPLSVIWLPRHDNGFRDRSKATAVLLLAIRLTLRRLMSYIYGAPILDVSRSHTTTQHGR